MNERFWEIVDKADKNLYLPDVPASILVKFAQLIVQECLEQIDDGNSDHAVGNREAIDRIKKHFRIDK